MFIAPRFRITIPALIVASLAALPGLWPGVALAQAPPYRSQWGSAGSGDGQFNNPSDVAVGPDGSVYVADAGNHRIQVFTSTGTFLRKWGSFGTGDDQFNVPVSVSVDAAGDVYVCEVGGRRIQVFTSTGVFLRKWGSSGSGDGQFNTPQGVHVDNAGNVYVGDTNNHRVQKFTTDSTFVMKWGSFGSGNGQFGFPKEIGTNAAGEVYVCDTSNHRIQKFTSDGAYLAKWGGSGPGAGQFNRPDHLCLGNGDSVFVADQLNHRVQKFTSSGTYVTQWGGNGTGDGQFSSPQGLVQGAGTLLYVADSGNNRIQVFGAPLPFVDIVAGLTGVESSSVAWGDYDNDGDLDILLTGASVSGPVSKIYRNSGGANPTFTDIVAGLTGVMNSSVAWGDYDNDGDLDILLTGAPVSGPVSKIYRNSGGANPTFTDIVAGLTGVMNSSVAWGDYDNDGDLDILLTGASVSGPVSKIYRNSGGANPTFTDIVAGLTGVEFPSVAWGDYDNDGDLDILLTGAPVSGPVSKIYRNSGGANPTFTDIVAGLTGVMNSSVAWGDYDNDGDLDILLTGASVSGPVSKIYRNSGGANPTFTDIVAGLTNAWNSSVAWGDYDNGGNLDILLAGDSSAGSVSKIYQGPGLSEIGTGLTAVRLSSVAWGDYDNDGDLDILLTGSDDFSRIAKVYRNDIAPSPNLSPNPPVGLGAQVVGSSLTFTWTAPSIGDWETENPGLNYNFRIGSSPGALDIATPMAAASGQRRVVQRGAIQANHWSMPLSALHTNPYWSVQALDVAFAGSPFAAEQQFILSSTTQIIADVAPDQGGWLYLTLNRSPLDDAAAVIPAASYGVWRKVPGTLLVADPGRSGTATEAARPDASGLDAHAAFPVDLDVFEKGGVFYVNGADPATPGLDAANPFPPGTWALVATVPALQQAQYVVAVPTVSNQAPNDYVVTTSTTTPSIWFASTVASGQSADNLAPAPPTPFSGTYSAGAAHLTWGANGENDLASYKLYRGATADFTPAPGNLVATVVGGTSYDDAGAVSGNYFKLSAVDVNGNASGYATTQAGTVTGVGDPGATAFALEGARPNPAQRKYMIVAFALLAAGSASLELLDMSGRRLVTREVGSLGAGRHTVTLAGPRPLAPGLYWIRLSQGANRKTVRATVLE